MTTPIGSGSGTQPETFEADPPGPIPTGTGEELLQQVIAMLDEQRSQARTARTAGRALSRSQARDRIGKMREAADFQLAGSIVKGASTAASSVAQQGDDQALVQSGGATGEAVLG